MKGARSKPGSRELSAHKHRFDTAIREHTLDEGDCFMLWCEFRNYVEDRDEKPYVPIFMFEWVKDCLLPWLRPDYRNAFTHHALTQEFIAQLGEGYIPWRTLRDEFIRDNPEIHPLVQRLRHTFGISAESLAMIAKHFKLRNFSQRYFTDDDQDNDEIYFTVAYYLGAGYRGPFTTQGIINEFNRTLPGGGIDETEPLPEPVDPYRL
jgi:hypothetical protein